MSAQPPSRASDLAAKAKAQNASRRGVFKALTALGLSMAPLRAQTKLQDRRPPFPDVKDQDQDKVDSRLAIAQFEHEKALKDAEDLASLSNELKDDIKKIGNFVVPVSDIKKTHEIEKLARRLRGHLQN